MLAVSYFFTHATAGLTIQFQSLLKVSCLFFARLRPGYALDPHISDHVVMMKVACITLSNRSINYRLYFSSAIHIGIYNAEWT